MGNSLFEQMKKSGLVDDKKAKKAKQSQYKSAKQKTKKGATKIDETALLAQKSLAEKAERDRQLNQQKKQAAEQRAIVAQIKQLIETNRIENSEGGVVYNFTDASVVKRLHISESVHKHLIAGRLSIAKLAGSYALVPTPVADKIKQRDAHCIIVCEPSAETAAGEDDPYADYQIPDDLMW